MGFRVESLGSGVQGSGFGGLGEGYRVKGFKVEGLSRPQPPENPGKAPELQNIYARYYLRILVHSRIYDSE